MDIICPLCNTEYNEDEATCPSCRAANPIYAEETSGEEAIDAEIEEGGDSTALAVESLLSHVEIDDEIEQTGLDPVYRASTEMIAAIVKGLLEGEGIPVSIASRQVPWMDGVMTMGEGYFGDLLVPATEADRARLVIEAYQSSSEQEEESS